MEKEIKTERERETVTLSAGPSEHRVALCTLVIDLEQAPGARKRIKFQFFKNEAAGKLGFKLQAWKNYQSLCAPHVIS